jgi:hypothetical protein
VGRAIQQPRPGREVHTHLTTRDHNRLARQQARTACAASLLRWLHIVVTQRVTWNPVIAAGGPPLNIAA